MDNKHLKKLLDNLVDYFSEGERFQKLIAPIIVKRDNEGKFDSIELFNRLTYTIVDQQRDVASVVIPIWVNMMRKGMNPEFLANSPYATEFVQSMFQAYGHQNYHTRTDFKYRGRGGSSRTDSFINAYKEYSPEEFLEFITENSDNIEYIFEKLIELKFISLKSASFFLRDVEGLEYDILPIDVNVAYSFQYTGVLFTESNAYHIESDVDVINSIIPVSQRTNITEYSQISDKIYSVCEELDYNPYEINRYLFLLGSDFCQTLKCEFCCVNQYCYYNNLPNPSLKQQFNDRIRSNNSK